MSTLDPGDFARNPEVDLFPELPKQPPLAKAVTREQLGSAIEDALGESGITLIRETELDALRAENAELRRTIRAMNDAREADADAGVAAVRRFVRSGLVADLATHTRVAVTMSDVNAVRRVSAAAGMAPAGAVAHRTASADSESVSVDGGEPQGALSDAEIAERES